MKDAAGLKQARTLLCFSDYSGEEADANYSVYSFILIDAEQIPDLLKITTPSDANMPGRPLR